MRAVVTGQVGMDKKNYLEAIAQKAAEQGEPLSVYHVGNMMYGEAPDVRPGRILDLSLSRLKSVRRSVFKDIINQSRNQKNIVVNTHATFRWRHGLFAAFDFDQMQAMDIDMLICLVDNIEVVAHRLKQEHTLDVTLKDLMVWREEEIMATELLAQALGCANRFYILSRGRYRDTIDTCYKLIFRPGMRKVYPSFPMSHVEKMPEIREEIDSFRSALAKHFISFDPGDVDEKLLLDRAIEAAKEAQDFIDVAMGGQTIPVSVKQVLDIAGDVDGQIYMRDFKLIDQSDMICSYIPELSGGYPALSSGVERELHHAFEHGKEVYVIYKPKKNPSPFITETATRVFSTTEQALLYFEEKGMFSQQNLFGQ